jgi:hypothetical protein
VRASILVSRGSAKYVFMDSRASAMVSSEIPWFLTASAYQCASVKYVGALLTVEEANIYACVPYLLRKSQLNVRMWIANILQISVDEYT